MAKLNKIMPPRNTKIRGQDHLLAYITPEEAQLLMANGGTGEAGPMGIPSYPEPGMGGSSDSRSGSGNSGSSSSGSSSSGSSSSGPGGGGGGGSSDADEEGDAIAEAAAAAAAAAASAAQQTMNRADERNYGTPNPTRSQIEQARGFDFGSDASNALAAQITGGYGGQLLGDQYGGSGFENQMFFDQLPDRLANAQSGYGLPGYAGGLAGAIGVSQLNRMRNQVFAGGIPAFNAAVPRGGNTGYGDRAFQGVFSKGPFGFDVYTGMPIEGNELTGYTTGGGDGDPRPEVAPVNPETGQCDAGYMFDEDMQACRLDTGFASGGQPDGFAPESGAYARMGLLDEAPTGLPEFQQRYGAGFGTPSEFADANLAFRQRGAYRPEYFDQPYPTTGYTLLS